MNTTLCFASNLLYVDLFDNFTSMYCVAMHYDNITVQFSFSEAPLSQRTKALLTKQNMVWFQYIFANLWLSPTSSIILLRNKMLPITLYRIIVITYYQANIYCSPYWWGSVHLNVLHKMPKSIFIDLALKDVVFSFPGGIVLVGSVTYQNS